MPTVSNEEAKAAVQDRSGVEAAPGRITRMVDNDFFHAFLRSKITVIAACGTLTLFLLAFLAPWIAPHDPFDLASISIMDARVPPVWMDYSDPRFVLGTDDQGRDLLSGIFYGMRISLIVGFCSVVAAAVIGITLGLVAGYMGGRIDAIIMRIADVQLTFPAILIALLIDGIAHGIFGSLDRNVFAFYILIVALALSFWVQYARTVRSSTMVEKSKEYVQAARVIGLPSVIIMARHILPNVMGPVMVIATINLALAIVTEATLSFLGVGMPPTQPSLGTLIAIGNDFLYSGEWWIAIFPGVALALLVLNVNLLGDWLRDALNPKLR
ncbi:ABC transporter permease [Labrenzia sp. OB1]|uniref:ABC transporter permease n=1 Tax=Labrenzia sp. OB1 TaxID=1561204 RepID=UPI000837CBE1|nr:ABC transporter permease [Labrenzia sp. OB1]